MTQEDKELLFKDICARLPYKVKVSYYDNETEREECDVVDSIYEDTQEIGVGQWCLKMDKFKPYLFPLSSMTEVQIAQLEFWAFMKEYHKITDFYYENHIDFRGLIEKGLALDATNLNIY